ncbi:helix-turn-helix domain-containing protein [Arsenicicoccus dermatophilus]|uniref:helix-turn-helix domain-containing protein n=1 Tax=Arsenicicoccus dermatophilus TaxID=1076331 RepID=UPI0039172DDC
MPREREALLSSGVRRRITELVEAEPDRWTALALADALGLHVTTVRFHLDQLEQAGVLESQPERRERPGRPRKVYRRATDTTPVSATAYVILADVLSATLADGGRSGPDVAARAEAADRAGAAWVQAHGQAVEPADTSSGADTSGSIPVRRLVDTLARWGYPPETVTVEGDLATRCQATLTYCPMIEAARRHPDVICGIHLGLVRGTLTELGVPDPQVRVVPMITPGVCAVDISTAAAAPGIVVEDGLDLRHVLPD